MITINHNQKHLWLESKILDDFYETSEKKLVCSFLGKKIIRGKNPAIEAQIVKFAKDKAIEVDNSLTYKTAQTSDVYRFVVGNMMEVLAEFYLKLFEVNNHNLSFIKDTSDDIFNRGFDLIGKAGIYGDMDVQIQVKWRDDKKHLFKIGELYTMLDEAEKANIMDKNLYLMVMSSDELNGSKVLHYKDDFKQLYQSRINVITGKMMEQKIIGLRSGRGLSGMEEFWTYFKECLS
jgi:hypothetical protein